MKQRLKEIAFADFFDRLIFVTFLDDNYLAKDDTLKRPLDFWCISSLLVSYFPKSKT